jgi:hypothetical protein
MSDQTYGRKTPTAAEREARKVFRQAEAKVAMSDHERAQKAFHENRERLKAERLAREAVSNDEPQNEKIRPKNAAGHRRRVLP